jgi:hypothetical protein
MLGLMSVYTMLVGKKGHLEDREGDGGITRSSFVPMDQCNVRTYVENLRIRRGFEYVSKVLWKPRLEAETMEG